MIVDAHAHLWAEHSTNRPWPPHGGPAHRHPPPTSAELLAVMDAAGVQRALIVPPSWEGDRNDVALEAARRQPDRFAVIGRFPLHDPTDARLLAGWLAVPSMLGIRVTLHREPWRSQFTSGGLDWLWAAAEAHAVPVMMYPPDLLPALARVPARHPALRLAIDHLAIPVTARGPSAFHHLDGLLSLAKHPNVAVKASALPCHTSHAAELRPVLHRLVDTFGPHRTFWGSDWTRLTMPYAVSLSLIVEALDFLPVQDRKMLLGHAVLDWLHWTVPEPAETAPVAKSTASR